MISSPPRMEIQQSMRRNSSSFYHASATTLFANHGDFFNTQFLNNNRQGPICECDHVGSEPTRQPLRYLGRITFVLCPAPQKNRLLPHEDGEIRLAGADSC